MKQVRITFMILLYSESFRCIYSVQEPTHEDCLSVAGNVLSVHQQIYGTGQLLASQDWFLILERRCIQERKTFSDFHDQIPWLITGKRRPSFQASNFTGKQLVAVPKFTSSKFAHLQHLDSTSVPSWKSNPVYLQFKYGNTNYGGKSGFHSLRRMVHTDLHLIMFNHFNTSSFLRIQNSIIYKHTIWLGCGCASHCKFNEALTQDPKNQIAHPRSISNQLCIYSSVKELNVLKQVQSCRDTALSIYRFREFVLQFDSNFEHYSFNSTSPVGDNSLDLPRANKSFWFRDAFPNKGYLYSSLVFITKKGADNTTNVWGPFSFVSWVGILAAYTVTAIVFGVIKIVTMNNLDNSWYDCLINQIFSLVNEEKVHRQKEQKLTTVCRYSPIVSNKIDVKNGSECYNFETGSRRISVQALPFSKSENGTYSGQSEVTIIIHRKHLHSRGKMSKAILYGTIRVVSFILLALYEGKLYNTITFPRSKLVASFDELISGEKYSIKFSNGVASHENSSDKIVPGDISYRGMSPHTTENKTKKVSESVTILDCVNWVESDPNTNHACVGYEFELRNLHKSQKSDKILVKSKRKLLRFGPGGSVRLSRRRGFTLFPGGFQISKWILESGILQLWSIVENAFMESLFNPNWSDPFKVFTIRDYLGLFVVYAMLLILASIMFLLEHSIVLCKRIVKNENLVKLYKRICRHLKLCKPTEFLLCKCRERKLFTNVRSKKYFRNFSPVHSRNRVSQADLSWSTNLSVV